MISTVFLVRHGENEASQQGLVAGELPVKLTERGYEQSRLISLRLKRFFCNVPGAVPVITSPILRTLQTAWIISEELGVSPEINSFLKEFPLGNWIGKTFFELRKTKEFISYIENPLQYPMGSGIFVKEVAKRVSTGLETLLSEKNTPFLVLVTHGGVIKLLVANALGMGLAHYNRLPCKEGSLSALQFHREKKDDPTWPRLLLFNEVP